MSVVSDSVMDMPEISIVLAALAAAISAVVTWLAFRAKYAESLAAASTERDVLRERVADLTAHHDESDATARTLAPLAQALQRVEHQVGALERDRQHQFGTIGAQLAEVSSQTTRIGDEAARLAGALRASAVRGAWGEVQLRRVLEAAGMLARCDFDEQVSAVNAHQVKIRPDVVVRLPGAKVIVIDAKAPMDAFLEAQTEGLSDDEVNGLLAGHGRALRSHVDALGGKAYWSAFETSPELVVCFVPAESMLAAALSADPGLMEHAAARKVALASPSTLLAMLRTVAVVWQQDAVAANAREIQQLGQELFTRLGTMAGHVDKMGGSLTRTVEQYNQFVGALERRVLVTARRMAELEVTTGEVAEPQPLEIAPRPSQLPLAQ